MPEIDDVVRTVLADTPWMTDEAFAAGRERVLKGKRKRRMWIPLAAAAAVVVTIATAALVGTTPDTRPETPAATTVLNKAADMIQSRDVQLAPGQYRYVRTEQIMVSATFPCQYRERNIDEVWIPRDQEAEWLLRRDYGNIEWITCQGGDSDSLPRKHKKEYRAKYGTFAFDDVNPSPPPSWYNLTPEFLASLPRDPRALFEEIKKEYASGTASLAKAEFQLVEAVLATAALPADLRAAMYRAMIYIPGLTVVENTPTLDGRKGTSLGLDLAGDRDRHELIINPEDGTFIGSRTVTPQGEVTGGKVLTYGVATEQGAPPMR